MLELTKSAMFAKDQSKIEPDLMFAFTQPAMNV